MVIFLWMKHSMVIFLRMKYSMADFLGTFYCMQICVLVPHDKLSAT